MTKKAETEAGNLHLSKNLRICLENIIKINKDNDSQIPNIDYVFLKPELLTSGMMHYLDSLNLNKFSELWNISQGRVVYSGIYDKIRTTYQKLFEKNDLEKIFKLFNITNIAPVIDDSTLDDTYSYLQKYSVFPTLLPLITRYTLKLSELTRKPKEKHNNLKIIIETYLKDKDFYNK